MYKKNNINRIIELFNVDYPVIQAGMIWCSGWELASAVSNAGALGLIGSGSMYPDVLKAHIQKCKQATKRPFGVNVPLMYPDIEKHMQIILDEGVKVVFTSAGNPKKWTPILKENGVTVAHVVSNTVFAKKCEDAGVDAIVAEGFEAGGHNGREETTTFCLIPSIREAVTLPVIAAGGIGSGRAILAAFVLGADGVQIGTRFVASDESSAHISFKHKILESKDGSTHLALKKLSPVRLLENRFYDDVVKLENNCGSVEDLQQLLGRGRAKRGMFLGDLDEGELEIGQVSACIKDIKPAGRILEDIIFEYNEAAGSITKILQRQK